jgi:hypothetical protein
MRKGLLVVTSVIGSVLLTLAITVGTLLYLMFSMDGDGPVHREALFGSLFFSMQETGEGTTGVTMGVANPVPLIIVFVVLAVVLTMAQTIYRGLKQRREQLIEKKSVT